MTFWCILHQKSMTGSRIDIGWKSLLSKKQFPRCLKPFHNLSLIKVGIRADRRSSRTIVDLFLLRCLRMEGALGDSVQ